MPNHTPKSDIDFFFKVSKSYYVKAYKGTFPERCLDCKESSHEFVFNSVAEFNQLGWWDKCMFACGIVNGAFVDAMVDAAVNALKDRLLQLQNKKLKIRLRGFSRGAVAALLLAKRIARDPELNERVEVLDVHAIDPVSGNSHLGALWSSCFTQSALVNRLDIPFDNSHVCIKKIMVQHHILSDRSRQMTFLARLKIWVRELFYCRWTMPEDWIKSKNIELEKKYFYTGHNIPVNTSCLRLLRQICMKDHNHPPPIMGSFGHDAFVMRHVVPNTEEEQRSKAVKQLQQSWQGFLFNHQDIKKLSTIRSKNCSVFDTLKDIFGEYDRLVNKECFEVVYVMFHDVFGLPFKKSKKEVIINEIKKCCAEDPHLLLDDIMASYLSRKNRDLLKIFQEWEQKCLQPKQNRHPSVRLRHWLSQYPKLRRSLASGIAIIMLITPILMLFEHLVWHHAGISTLLPWQMHWVLCVLCVGVAIGVSWTLCQLIHGVWQRTTHADSHANGWHALG